MTREEYVIIFSLPNGTSMLCLRDIQLKQLSYTYCLKFANFFFLFNIFLLYTVSYVKASLAISWSDILTLKQQTFGLTQFSWSTRWTNIIGANIRSNGYSCSILLGNSTEHSYSFRKKAKGTNVITAPADNISSI